MLISFPLNTLMGLLVCAYLCEILFTQPQLAGWLFGYLLLAVSSATTASLAFGVGVCIYVFRFPVSGSVHEQVSAFITEF